MTTNRETWLRQVAERMAPRFAEMGFPLPAFRASIGWPSAGSDSPAIGECWDKRVSGDGHFEIFINPGQADSEAIACVLAHELIHAAVGLKEGHKGAFARVALDLGFARPLTHASASTPAKLAEWVRPIVESVGPIPHAKISTRRTGIEVERRGGGIVPREQPEAGGGEGEEPAPRSSRPKTQTTRMRKCQCAAPDCGYTVRVTSKWLEVGPPHCPLHGAMRNEDDSAGG